ncbi:MAG: hypothetical protein J0I12_16965 [Candidatus Eremiobacteraeota bacterium]|nr:hypothetical protein [Candidatus Eremiobacteraeota bacterium]
MMKRLHKLWLGTLLGLLAVGCGGANDTTTSFGGAYVPPGNISPATTVVGRLYLGGDISGARFRLVGQDGTQIAEGITNDNGIVFFDNLALPANFHAEATVPGSDIRFAAEMRNFNPRERQVHISVLSTLASEVAQARGLNIEDAEALVKKGLKLPSGLKTGVALLEPNPVFSSLAVFREAGRNGGWAAYRQQLLDQAERASTGGSNFQPRVYQVTEDMLDRPIPGLETGLSQAVNSARLTMAAKLNIEQATGARLNMRFRPPLVFMVEGPSSLGGQFLLGIATGLGGNILTDAVGSAVGWGANMLGLNFGTSGQLTQIESQLTDIENQLFQAKQAVYDSTLQANVNSLDAEFNPFVDFQSNGTDTGATGTLTTSIRSAITAISQGTLTLNTPYTPDVSALVTAISQEQKYPGVLSDADTKLAKSNSLIDQLRTVVLNQQLGLDTPSNMQSFPWRHNRILARITPLFRRFSLLQTATLNIAAEAAHNYALHPKLIDGINFAGPNFDSNIFSQKQQRQHLPFESGLEGIITDAEYGTMWFDTVYNPDTSAHARSNANSAAFQVVLSDTTVHTYDDWHLPVSGEMFALQKRGQYSPSSVIADKDLDGHSDGDLDDEVPVNSTDSYPDPGQSTGGLPGLGFYNVAKAFTLDTDGGDDGDLWMDYYNYNNGGLFGDPSADLDDDAEFRLNHNNSYYGHLSSSDKRCYVYCRTFGPDFLNFAYAGGDDWVAGDLLPSEVVGKAFIAAECAQYGNPTAFTFSDDVDAQPVTYPVDSNGTTQTYTPPVGSKKLQVKVTYEVNIGGTFTLGYGTTRSEKTDSHTNTGQIWAYYQSTDPNAPQVNAINELINWQSSDSSVASVLNLPLLGGIVVPHQNGSVTVNATLLKPDGTTLVGNKTFTSTAPTRSVRSLQISPRNQVYSNLSSSGSNFNYYCSGFWSDDTVVDNSTQVSWSVDDPTNQSHAVFVTTSNGVQLSLAPDAQATPTPYNVTINASYQGKTDSTIIQIVPPRSTNQ